MTTETSMNLDDLRRIDARYRAEKPNLFRLSSADAAASEEQLTRVEGFLGIKLPSSYRGSFGLTTIFSADPNGEWYLPRKQGEALKYLPDGLLAFSDDFAGGYYVLRVEKDLAQEAIYYWNDDGGLIPTEFENVLAFVARYGYESA